MCVVYIDMYVGSSLADTSNANFNLRKENILIFSKLFLIYAF